MALFPAYKDLSVKNQPQGEESKNLLWLQNESCPSSIIVLEKTNFDESENKLCSTDEGSKLLRLESSFVPDSKQQDEIIFQDSVYGKQYTHKKQSKLKRKPNRRPEFEKQCSLFPTKNHNKNVFLQNSISSIKPEDIIYFDYIGDNNNVLFASTHYTQFAKYCKRKKFYLGNIQRECRQRRKKANRYFQKLHSYADGSFSASRLCDRDIYPETTKGSSFILLEWNKHNLTDNKSSNLLNIMDLSTENYILGKSNVKENDDLLETTKDPIWKLRIKEYNEMVQKEPNNISLWLKFVEMQDQINVLWLGKERKNINKVNLVGVSEKKIAILDVAIKKNENCRRLYIERLKIGQDIWDQENLIEEWDKLLNKFPNDVIIWHELLTFYQTYYLTFHLNNVIKIYIKYKEKLLQDVQLSSQSDLNENYYQLINGAVQLAYLWKQGGFIERSIALFQAFIELNFHCPTSLRKSGISQEIVIDIFEAFWDSQAPRFGEKNSVGWGKFIEKKEIVSFPDKILEGTQDEEDLILSQSGDKATANLWLQLELSRELNHWLPWQLDPEECEDSERLVNFSDLRPHLFIIKSEKCLFFFILQFLSFLGVTIPVYVYRDFDYKEQYSSLSRLRIESLLDLLMKVESLDKTEDYAEEFYFPAIGPSVRKLSDDGYFQYVHNTIKFMMDLFPVKYQEYLSIILIRLFAERYLMLRNTNCSSLSSVTKEFKKEIKHLFKRPELQNNLNIFYEYALYEKSLGHFDEALKIHAMSVTSGLQVTNLADSKSDADICVLMKHIFSAIKIEFIREENSVAKCAMNSFQNLICSIFLENQFSIEATPPSSISVLKAKKRLNELVEISLTKFKVEIVVPLSTGYYTTFLALLQFMTSGFKPACLMFEDILALISKLGLENPTKASALITLQELLYENYVWFIHMAPNLRHINPTLPMSPIAVRNIIYAAIEVSPCNLDFLHALSNCEFKLWRDILLKIRNLDSKEDASILVSIFQLLPHIRKAVQAMSEPGGSDSNYQILSCLESAVNTTAGKHCPLLWRLYLRITHHLSPKNLKTLTCRAMDSCPFAKSVYLDCIYLVPESHSEILSVMNEKGIRVRLPLEELNLLLENEEEIVNTEGN